MNSLDEAAHKFIALFEQMAIPYAVMGGLAVRMYALPRPTFDVDFTVSLARRPAKDLVDVADLLFVQGSLDEPYMRTWAGRIQIADALDRALSESRKGL